MKVQKNRTLLSQGWIQIVFLIAVCLLLYFVNLDRWDLWKPDEPRYAKITEEMMQGGDWILMHLNGQMYTDKPPLFFWMIAFSSLLWNGFTSFAIRFPSAVFGTLSVILTYLIGRRLYSSRVGFLAGLILATSLEFAYLSIRANLDATLTFFTTFSIYWFIRWYSQIRGEGETRKGASSLSIYGLYVGMGLATLTKGPVGFALPLLVSLTYLIIQRDWKGIRQMRLLPGLGLCVAMVLSWYVAAILRGGRTFLEETLLLHTVKYYAVGWDHVKPFYFYLGRIPIDFMPWVPFLPVAIAYGYSKGTLDKRKEFLFLLIWFAVILLFFSISKGKRGLYLLPLYPAASLMVGKLWEDFVSSRVGGFWNRITSALCLVFMLVGVIGGLGILLLTLKKSSFQLPQGLWVAFFLIGISFTAGLVYRFKRYGVLFMLLLVVVGGGFFYTQYALFPLVNEFKSTHLFMEDVKKDLGLDTLFQRKKSHN